MRRQRAAAAVTTDLHAATKRSRGILLITTMITRIFETRINVATSLLSILDGCVFHGEEMDMRVEI